MDGLDKCSKNTISITIIFLHTTLVINIPEKLNNQFYNLLRLFILQFAVRKYGVLPPLCKYLLWGECHIAYQNVYMINYSRLGDLFMCVLVTYACEEVLIYDSMYSTFPMLAKAQIPCFLLKQQHTILVKFMHVQIQCGVFDCGPFAITLKTDTSCSEAMDVSGLLEGRGYGDVSETWLWTASSSSETFMDVHVNNSRLA